jgi:hypothetical protein
MEKYSKPEEQTFSESSSATKMSKKQSEINAEFTKEEKTSPENNAKDKHEETRLEECDSEKRMDESGKEADGKSLGKQTKGRGTTCLQTCVAELVIPVTQCK